MPFAYSLISFCRLPSAVKRQTQALHQITAILEVGSLKRVTGQPKVIPRMLAAITRHPSLSADFS